MVLAPGMGVPSEELLQDTLKSILVSLFSLGAAFMLFLNLRTQPKPVYLHPVMYLPLGLMAYALGSMAWSHTYLAGVESIRWFVFSTIVFVGANTLTPAKVTRLAWGIHIGATAACVWTAFQFWFDFALFPQGADPASTFVNRNFFAEYVVCTLPFSALLIYQTKEKMSALLLTFAMGFNIAALMMTGARSALVGLMLLVALLPAIALLYKTSSGWSKARPLGLIMLLGVTVWSFGSIHTANKKLIAESGPVTALERAFKRTASITNSTEYTNGSFAVRTDMWRATGRMVLTNPLTGVGAGAWEVHIPRYQDADTQLELDYYAHNEILQMLAEYGIVAWVFLISLASYLVWTTYRTWLLRSNEHQVEAPVRAFTLASLLVLLLVSNAGFPWHLATTGALFSLSLAILIASDIRLYSLRIHKSLQWKPRCSTWALSWNAACIAFAIYICQQAIESESKLTRALKLALTISQSGVPNDPRWIPAKTQMLRWVGEGIAINPHYRKLTPSVADEFARWGDWKNANWIWESTLASRPYVTGILTNLTRGYIHAGDLTKAEAYFDRAKTNGFSQTSVIGNLDTLLLRSKGKTQQAGLRAKELLTIGTFDYETTSLAYSLGILNHDPDLAIFALKSRLQKWPALAVVTWLKLGEIYATRSQKDELQAILSYRAALNAGETAQKAEILSMIPPEYRAKVQ
jgi:O-antigen ligase